MSFKREEKAYQHLLDYPNSNPNPVFRVNKSGEIIFANASAGPILSAWKAGIKSKIPLQWREVIHQVLAAQKPQTLELALTSHTYLLNIVPQDKEGTIFYAMDISTRKAMEKELERHTTTDELTQLPNRIIFEQNFAIELNHAKASHLKIGVMIIRADDYREIMSTYGVSISDGFLKAFSERLVKTLNKRSLIARVGDDEFAVVDPDVRDASTMEVLLDNLIEKCTEPYQVENQELFITMSIGVAFFPQDGDTAEILMRNANLAVNRTSSTRNQYEFFQRGMVEQLQVKRGLIVDLNKAIDNHELILHYQPQINIHRMQMTGCEALLRWKHPEKGFISPAFFMPAAEETQLVLPIGEWVLRQACWQIVKWRKEGMEPIKVAVNVSARQFFQSDIVSLVEKIILETGISSEWLDIELTETAMMSDIYRAVDIMKDLRDLGVGLALDDFGTGYSSLSYLMRFPVTKLKIDRSFIKEIEAGNSEKYAVTKGIIDLGHSLNLKIIAEGVETQAQLDYLKEHGCDIIQGFYFAKPEAAEDFEPFFVKEWKG